MAAIKTWNAYLSLLIFANICALIFALKSANIPLDSTFRWVPGDSSLLHS